MLKKVENINYFAACYLAFEKDNWKYQDNPYAIEIDSPLKAKRETPDEKFRREYLDAIGI